MPAVVYSTPDYDERLEVLRRRYREARGAGLTLLESRMFAESTCDIGVLRRLVSDGCPPATIARIVT